MQSQELPSDKRNSNHLLVIVPPFTSSKLLSSIEKYFSLFILSLMKESDSNRIPVLFEEIRKFVIEFQSEETNNQSRFDRKNGEFIEIINFDRKNQRWSIIDNLPNLILNDDICVETIFKKVILENINLKLRKNFSKYLTHPINSSFKFENNQKLIENLVPKLDIDWSSFQNSQIDKILFTKFVQFNNSQYFLQLILQSFEYLFENIPNEVFFNVITDSIHSIEIECSHSSYIKDCARDKYSCEKSHKEGFTMRSKIQYLPHLQKYTLKLLYPSFKFDDNILLEYSDEQVLREYEQHLLNIIEIANIISYSSFQCIFKFIYSKFYLLEKYQLQWLQSVSELPEIKESPRKLRCFYNQFQLEKPFITYTHLSAAPAKAKSPKSPISPNMEPPVDEDLKDSETVFHDTTNKLFNSERNVFVIDGIPFRFFPHHVHSSNLNAFFDANLKKKGFLGEKVIRIWKIVKFNKNHVAQERLFILTTKAYWTFKYTDNEKADLIELNEKKSFKRHALIDYAMIDVTKLYQQVSLTSSSSVYGSGMRILTRESKRRNTVMLSKNGSQFEENIQDSKSKTVEEECDPDLEFVMFVEEGWTTMSSSIYDHNMTENARKQKEKRSKSNEHYESLLMVDSGKSIITTDLQKQILLEMAYCIYSTAKSCVPFSQSISPPFTDCIVLRQKKNLLNSFRF
ncbi:predicted protein [Naegleria gruberi]|uniref:Predicted protein n=1 Tax=Naegleria gruberi TaxID=5762 RepID=D2VQT6_NAEGR|nr:uncharacterized protein NAEGRDRAFT_71341 [Naegleria gruberi]EFC40696.1 predicted protein [Naegleria gruberi]|eukprot:XP_002673440.1 predicted protein [Naegleria gruberi strain NEG-M]